MQGALLPLIKVHFTSFPNTDTSCQIMYFERCQNFEGNYCRFTFKNVFNHIQTTFNLDRKKDNLFISRYSSGCYRIGSLRISPRTDKQILTQYMSTTIYTFFFTHNCMLFLLFHHLHKDCDPSYVRTEQVIQLWLRHFHITAVSKSRYFRPIFKSENLSFCCINQRSNTYHNNT